MRMTCWPFGHPWDGVVGMKLHLIQNKSNRSAFCKNQQLWHCSNRNQGEVLINKNNFKAYNEKLIEEGIPPFANPKIQPPAL
jgi:NAD-dependent DNA ligase